MEQYSSNLRVLCRKTVDFVQDTFAEDVFADHLRALDFRIG
jgi:hypothetical protein